MTAREEVSRQDSRERPMRERFEAWAKKQPRYGKRVPRLISEGAPAAGEYAHGGWQEAWEAWQAAEAQRPSVAGADGWQLVPKEPTDEMVRAAHGLDLSYMPGHEGPDRACVYRAMLAAAPRPPAAADEREARPHPTHPDHQGPYWLGAQNDALWIIKGHRPALSNDDPNHDANREPICQVADTTQGYALVAALNRAAQSHPVAPAAHERCDTTKIERFVNPACVCKTYDGNLGPCGAHEVGGNGRCAWCDHEMTCISPAATQGELFDRIVSIYEARNGKLRTDALLHLRDAVREALAASSQLPAGQAVALLRRLVAVHDHPGNRFASGIPEIAEWQEARNLLGVIATPAVESYSEGVDRMRAEGTYRDTVATPPAVDPAPAQPIAPTSAQEFEAFEASWKANFAGWYAGDKTAYRFGWIDGMAYAAAPTMTARPVIAEIAAERERQISVEGWTPEHDDEHNNRELAHAAASFAMAGAHPDHAQLMWPWGILKIKDERSNLIRAGALIVAEIERLDRALDTKQGGANG